MQDKTERLIDAVEFNRDNDFQSLLNDGEIANFINRRSKVGNSDVTALDMAANIGRVSFVLQLLKARADVNSRDGDSNTALHWASLNGNSEVVDKLLSAGAQLSNNCVGTNALHDAAKNGHLEVLKKLAVKFPESMDTPMVMVIRLL